MAEPPAKRARFMGVAEPINIPKAMHDIEIYMRLRFDPVPFSRLVRDLDLDEHSQGDLEKLKQAIGQPHTKLSLEDDEVSFKPRYDVRNYDDLLAKLKDFADAGLGGMRCDDLEESYGGIGEDFQRLKESNLVYIISRKERPATDVMFYKDPDLLVEVDADIKAEFHKVSVETKHDKDFHEYLQKAELKPLQVATTVQTQKKKKKKAKKDILSQGDAARQAQRILRDTNPDAMAPPSVVKAEPDQDGADA